MQLHHAARAFMRLPWRDGWRTLRARFRDEQLGLTASSLTFTTLVSLVPFFTVLLAVFTVFPAFGKLQGVLQQWLTASLFPESVARQIVGYLGQFAARANRMGGIGLVFLVITALSLMFTIDRTLNRIWRVPRPRPWTQRFLVYWTALTLGPVAFAGSLALSSYALSASAGWVGTLPFAIDLLLECLQFLVTVLGVSALYHYVPNTRVEWDHAVVGGVFVAFSIELAKRVLGLYLGNIPTFSLIYGTFATLPILMLWIYILWVVVLMGAVIAASLPGLMAGAVRQLDGPGWQFQLAVEVLGELYAAQGRRSAGLTTAQLARVLRVDGLQLEPALEALGDLEWTAHLAETDPDAPLRHVLLIDPEATALGPLMHRLLLRPGAGSENLVDLAGMGHARVSEVL